MVQKLDPISPTVQGVGFLVLGMLIFSLQDIAVIGGVLLIVQPGSATFNIGTVCILISVLFYALSTILTRKLQSTDSSATMSYYSSLVYLIATFFLAPLVMLVGDLPDAHPSIAFLFRAWAMPTLLDWGIMSGLGLVWAGGMYCAARAYSLASASVVAPFEYTALPINVIWGFIIWRELPQVGTVLGAALTLLSGLYILYRARIERTAATVTLAIDQPSKSTQRMVDC